MEGKKYDINHIIDKLNRGEDITQDEERFYLKNDRDLSDEEIDTIFAIANNTDPNVIID